MTQRDLDTSALAAEEVVNGLKTCYKKTVLPLEKDYKYDMYFSAPLKDVDFEAKPLVLILGQYSTGKTTFIKHMIGRDFPGLRIGPEPTTDKFSCVYYGPTDQIIPGNVLTNNPELPFQELSRFGNNFLNKFEGSACASNTLKSFMFVDSPGVLSGKKQRTRQYPYDKVVEWFAEKAVRILLLFDCSKLDVSDEFKQVITLLRKHDEKIRVVLNKADSISEKELIRVYGALMWNLGKVFKTPEVLRVYISSFHDKPLNKDNYCYQLFKGDAADLIGELKSLPRQGAMQKVNDILKRMRLVKVHAQIISELAGEMPYFGFGRKKIQKQIVEDLPKKFRAIARSINVPPSDFPSLENFQERLAQDDLSKYLTMQKNARKFKMLQKALDKTVPRLVKRLNDRTNYMSPEEAEKANYNPFSTKNAEQEADSASKSDANTNAFSDIIDTKDSTSKPQEINVPPHYAPSRASVSARSRNSRNSYNRNAVSRYSGNITKQVPSAMSTEARDEFEDPLPERQTSSKRATKVGSYYEEISPEQFKELGQETTQKKFPGHGLPKKKPSFTSAFSEEDDEGETVAPKTVLAHRMPRRDSQTQQEWVVSLVDKTESDNVFFAQNLVNGKLTGSSAKSAFAFLKLPKKTLNRIWVLVDFNKTNELDPDQFALAVWLGKNAINGIPVPSDLSWQMIPPSYRD